MDHLLRCVEFFEYKTDRNRQSQNDGSNSHRFATSQKVCSFLTGTEIEVASSVIDLYFARFIM